MSIANYLVATLPSPVAQIFVSPSLSSCSGQPIATNFFAGASKTVLSTMPDVTPYPGTAATDALDTLQDLVPSIIIDVSAADSSIVIPLATPSASTVIPSHLKSLAGKSTTPLSSSTSTKLAASFIHYNALELRATTLITSPSPSPTAIKCSSSSGYTYLGASNQLYRIQCYTDRQLGQYQVEQVRSFSACIDLCDADQDCLVVAYTGKLVGGNCYLKNAVGPPNTDLNVWGAIAIVMPGETKTAPLELPKPTFTGPPAIAERLTCPDSDKTVYRHGEVGASFSIACGTDYFGGDMRFEYAPTLEACLGLCASESGCVAVSYMGTNSPCYMKSAALPGRRAMSVTGAVLAATGRPVARGIGMRLA